MRTAGKERLVDVSVAGHGPSRARDDLKRIRHSDFGFYHSFAHAGLARRAQAIRACPGHRPSGNGSGEFARRVLW